MPLPHFLALVLGVIAAVGLTIWAASGLTLSIGVMAGFALVAALTLRALAWR